MLFALLSLSALAAPDLEVEKVAASTPTERLAYATETEAKLERTIGSMQDLLVKARRQGDAQALLCVDARLTSVQALLSVTRAATASLKRHLDAGDADHAVRELRKVRVARDRSGGLLHEAETCIAPADNASPAPWVDVSQLEPVGDPEDTEFPEALDIDDEVDIRPPVSSPFL